MSDSLPNADSMVILAWKVRASKESLDPYLPFSLYFWYTQSMHKQTIIDFKELGLRHIFTKPLKELKTRDLDQVETLLREAEAYQEAGYDAVG